MNKRGEQTEQPKTERQNGTLWQRLLTVLLPVLATAMAGSFIALCISYLAVRPLVTIELGTASPQAEAFLHGSEKEISYLVEPQERYKTVGNYPLKVLYNGHVRPVLLRVRDTVAPAAEPVETTVSTKQTLSPDRLVTDLKDQSILKLTYRAEPEYGTVGDYDALVCVQDQSGNELLLDVPVHVRIVRESIVLEAGSAAPGLDAFLLDDYDAAFLTEITDAMMTQPGTYPIRITADGTEVESKLIVQDTIAPSAVAKAYAAKPGTAVSPEDFLSSVEDATKVTASFVISPDPDSREPQTVSVRLTDLGGNETVLTSMLLFSGVAPVSIEASDQPLTAEKLYGGQSGAEVVFEEPFIPNRIGMQMVPVRIDGQENLAVIDVQDTIAPALSVRVYHWYLNAPKDVDFFVEVSDATETTLAFETEPDWTAEMQDLTVTAVDAAGNRTGETFTLILTADVTPPVLYGVRDRYCYLNEPVAYLKEVSAEDNCDGPVEVQVDASKVDATKAGVYSVTYSVTDRAGNTLTKTVRFTFVAPQVTEEEAEAVAQKVLGEILTDGMTLAEQIRAIYDYVHSNVHYVYRSNKTDWRSEAVRGLTTGYGDCFTAYASARLLLEHTDAQLLSVERYNEPTHHYWLLVNIGTGWYHFDACRTRKSIECFMWTNAQTNAVSRRYWHYDESLYPPVATERFQGGK